MIKTERVPTGITGLDHLIEGGLPKGRSILVTGEPGTGKTILALQFLVDGLKRGEKGIYVTADESPMDVLEQAASLGWDLEERVEAKEMAILNAATYLSTPPAPARKGKSTCKRRSAIWLRTSIKSAPKDSCSILPAPS